MGFLQKLFGGKQAAGGKIGELVQVLATDLNLDANQVSSLKAAVQAFREKRREIKSAGGDRSQIQQARQQMKEQMINTFNEQQKQTFIANLAKYDAILEH